MHSEVQKCMKSLSAIHITILLPQIEVKFTESNRIKFHNKPTITIYESHVFRSHLYYKPNNCKLPEAEDSIVVIRVIARM